MPFGGALTIGVLSGLGGLFSNRGGKTTQNTNSTQTQNVDMSTMPQYDPKAQSLRDYLINLYMDNLKSNDDYFQGYTANGMSEINKSADASQRQIENALASRGIQGPMAGAGLAAPMVARQGQVSSFLNSIPQLRDQRQQGILQSGSQFLNSLPVGQKQTGTNTTTGNSQTVNTTPGNMLGGFFGNLGTSLAGMYGEGAFGAPKTQAASNPQPSVPAWQAPATYGINSNWQMPTTFGAPLANPWTPTYYGGKR